MPLEYWNRKNIHNSNKTTNKRLINLTTYKLYNLFNNFFYKKFKK